MSSLLIFFILPTASGGIPLASTAISTSAGSIFNTVTTSASVTGLGGADPAISATNSGEACLLLLRFHNIFKTS